MTIFAEFNIVEQMILYAAPARQRHGRAVAA